jgi:hypothetical protein
MWLVLGIALPSRNNDRLKQSAQSRVKVLSMLADRKIPLLAYHFAWPGIGHVAKQGDGFRFYPEGMKMEL